jgi:hypothetical protein
MAIKFLDQAISKLRQRRTQTGIQIDEDKKEIAYIDRELAILAGKQGRVKAAQDERRAARDKLAQEVVRCTEGFQTVSSDRQPPPPSPSLPRAPDLCSGARVDSCCDRSPWHPHPPPPPPSPNTPQVINNAKNLNRRGGKEAKQIMGRTHVARGNPHISNRD